MIISDIDIFPYGTPEETKYWLLGICFSNVLYEKNIKWGKEFLYPRFDSNWEYNFVKQVRDLFRIDIEIHSKSQTESEKEKSYKEQWWFSFPQRKKDYRSFFHDIGITHPKKSRHFPIIPEEILPHFIRGYFDCQSGIHRENNLVSISFNNRYFGEGFRDSLSIFGISKLAKRWWEEKRGPLMLHPDSSSESWQIKLGGRNLNKFYTLLYEFPYRITFRRSKKKEFDQFLNRPNLRTKIETPKSQIVLSKIEHPQHKEEKLLNKKNCEEKDRVDRKMKTRIKKRRQTLKITQADLARALSVHPHYLSRVENGHTIPNVGFALNLAKALRCKVEELWII